MSFGKVIKKFMQMKQGQSEHKPLGAYSYDSTDQQYSRDGMKKGGMVRSSASKRADGCAQRGKTRA